MELIFYFNSSPKNKIGKDLTEATRVQGTIKQNCSVTDPVIEIEFNSFPPFNYMQIPAFNGRYYFIDEITNEYENMWILRAKVDVLESYKTAILAQQVILADSGNVNNPYVNNDAFVVSQKTKTDIMQFPNGLLDNGTFILVTAGGIASL